MPPIYLVYLETSHTFFSFIINSYLMIKRKTNFFQFTHEKRASAITVKRTTKFRTDFSRRKQEKRIQITELYKWMQTI